MPNDSLKCVPAQRGTCGKSVSPCWISSGQWSCDGTPPLELEWTSASADQSTEATSDQYIPISLRLGGNRAPPDPGLASCVASQVVIARDLTAAPSNASNYWMVSGQRAGSLAGRSLELRSLGLDHPRRCPELWFGDSPGRSALGNAHDGCLQVSPRTCGGVREVLSQLHQNSCGRCQTGR